MVVVTQLVALHSQARYALTTGLVSVLPLMIHMVMEFAVHMGLDHTL